MTLAHLPTQRAKDLLAEFERSDRAGEVAWLECAIDENTGWLLSPETEQEERDFLAVRVIGEIREKIIDLEGKIDGRNIEITKDTIRVEALQKLSPVFETGPDIQAIESNIQRCQKLIEEYQLEIQLSDAVSEKIRESIQTDKYKDIDPWDLRGMFLDGEGL